jgi:hypothetical protein
MFPVPVSGYRAVADMTLWSEEMITPFARLMLQAPGCSPVNLFAGAYKKMELSSMVHRTKVSDDTPSSFYFCEKWQLIQR